MVKKTETKESEIKVAEDPKTEEKTDYGAIAKKAAKIILGILIVLAGLGLIWWWFGPFVAVFKGVIGVLLVLIGLIVVAIGWTD